MAKQTAANKKARQVAASIARGVIVDVCYRADAVSRVVSEAGVSEGTAQDAIHEVAGALVAELTETIGDDNPVAAATKKGA